MAVASVTREQFEIRSDVEVIHIPTGADFRAYPTGGQRFNPDAPRFRAVGKVPDGRFVGRLEIADVQHLARPGSFGKTHEQGLFLGKGHVFALASAHECATAPHRPRVLV